MAHVHWQNDHTCTSSRGVCYLQAVYYCISLGPFSFSSTVCVLYISCESKAPWKITMHSHMLKGLPCQNKVSLSSSSSSSWTRATVTHINHGIIVVVSWVEVITVPFGSQVNVFHVHGDRAVILFVNTCCHNNHRVQSRDLRRAGQRVERNGLLLCMCLINYS